MRPERTIDPALPETDGAMRSLIVLGAFAALLKLALALTTRGTNDAVSFWVFHRKSLALGVLGLYEAERLFNHPPFVLVLLRFWAFLQGATGLPFAFWLRCFQILADAGSLYLVFCISRHFLADRLRLAPLWLTALAPASLFVSGFHGNNDPLMIFFVLLAVFLASVKDQYALAGAAFGMSCNIKAWPIVLLPVLFFQLRDWPRRFRFFAAAGLVVFAASCPYILQDPALIVSHVLYYGSSPGCWGVTRLLSLSPSLIPWNVAYIANARFMMILLITAASLRLNRLAPRPPLFAQVGFVTFSFLVLTPGFGVQYIAWLVPWLAWSRVWYAAAFHLVTGTFLFLVYTFWSRGLPWDYANAAVGPWPPQAIAFELASWGLVAAYLPLAVHGFRRLRQGGVAPPKV